MREDELAHLVAGDLTRYLSTWSAENTTMVFGLAVWAGDDYGNFAVSFGTEEWFDGFRRVPANLDLPDEQLHGPYYRWWSGNWDTIMRPFLSPETERLLAPLAVLTCDDSVSVETQAEASQRWREIGYKAVELTGIPSALRTSGEPLCFAESPDGDCVDVAEEMLRTVAPQQFHTAIPAWRRLAGTVRSSHAGSHADDGGQDVLVHQLRACGLEMYDMTGGSERLQRALAIADRT